MSSEPRESGRGIGDQIGRYRNAFIAVVTMIILAAISGGYILAHERLYVPGWVPVIGQHYFTLSGEFSTSQAITPGQGQAVTIAGAKVGEIARVDLRDGRALVTMHLTPKYARYIYRNATMLVRPKTELKDMALQIDPGTASSGQVVSGEVIPVSQTAPNINLDQFLASLDGETRAYLQLLLAGAGGGLKGNGANLSAILKRFSPLARNTALITRELKYRDENIARSIHNFRLLIEALGGKDRQLAEVIDASNAVFRTFSEQDSSVQRTLELLPGALSKTDTGLGKLTRAFNVVGPTVKELHPFASSLAPALEQSRPLLKESTPIIKNEIRPFLREILPFVSKIQPSSQKLAEASPDLATGFSVFNELFNELAYNPGPKQGGFLFFLDWANHNFNSVISSADAHGTLGHSLLYFNCDLVPLLSGVAKVNPAVHLILGLLNPPTGAACATSTTSRTAATTSSARPHRGGLGDLSPFGRRTGLTAALNGLARGH